LYLTHSLDGEVKGLDDFKGKHPPVAAVFWGFRVMVGTGLLMLAVGWLGALQLRKHGEVKPWLARALVAMTFVGWVATLAGWYVTEIGRQPYLVYGILSTAQAAATVPTPMLAGTLAMYLTVYLALLVAYVSVVFHMARKAGIPAPVPTPITAPISTVQGASYA
jgi:cytochrome bd ubiquinol oxidase subunit I